MSFQTRYPSINPRLGTLYAIFTSGLIATVMIFIICERLGMGRFALSYIVSSIPLALASLIALITATNKPEDFFVSGRRVPASFNGFALAATSLGGTGLLIITGLFFLNGFDTLALLVGWCLGLFLMGLLYAPFIRRMGSYSIPAFFAERFDDDKIGTLATALIIPPLALLLVAELKIGAFAAGLVTGLPQTIILSGLAILVALSGVAGGMRSLTWSNSAYFIVLILGFLVPLIILSIKITNLPLPQITYGTLFEDLVRLELINGLSEIGSRPMSAVLSGEAPRPIDKLYLQTFGSLSQTNFALLLICVMLGVATLPTLLIRATTVPTVNDARRAAGWGLALLGVILISAPAYAVFIKYLTLQNLLGATIDQLPEWVRDLVNLKLVEIRDQDQNATVNIKELFVPRDGVAFILPVIAGLPFALIVMTVTAALSAAICSASAQMVVMANAIARNFIAETATAPDQKSPRIPWARTFMILAAASGAWFALTIDTDPLWLVLWALSISASTFFAPLTFSIFWNNFSSAAAKVSMHVGFWTSIAYIALTPTDSDGLIFGISHLVAGAIGIPASVLAALFISSLGPDKKNKTTDKILEDLRSPGNFAIVDMQSKSARHRSGRR